MGAVGEALHTAGTSADNTGIVEYNSQLMARQLGPASTPDLSDLALSSWPPLTLRSTPSDVHNRLINF